MLEWIFLRALLRYFSIETGLKISDKKSFLLYSCSDQGLTDSLLNIFPFSSRPIEKGLKYLGFIIKPNGYGAKDLDWILKSTSRKINSWTFCHLSLGGRLVLCESVLQGIPVY